MAEEMNYKTFIEDAVKQTLFLSAEAQLPEWCNEDFINANKSKIAERNLSGDALKKYLEGLSSDLNFKASVFGKYMEAAIRDFLKTKEGEKLPRWANEKLYKKYTETILKKINSTEIDKNKILEYLLALKDDPEFIDFVNKSRTPLARQKGSQSLKDLFNKSLPTITNNLGVSYNLTFKRDEKIGNKYKTVIQSVTISDKSQMLDILGSSDPNASPRNILVNITNPDNNNPVVSVHEDDKGNCFAVVSASIIEDRAKEKLKPLMEQENSSISYDETTKTYRLPVSAVRRSDAELISLSIAGADLTITADGQSISVSGQPDGEGSSGLLSVYTVPKEDEQAFGYQFNKTFIQKLIDHSDERFSYTIGKNGKPADASGVITGLDPREILALAMSSAKPSKGKTIYPITAKLEGPTPEMSTEISVVEVIDNNNNPQYLMLVKQGESLYAYGNFGDKCSIESVDSLSFLKNSQGMYSVVLNSKGKPLELTVKMPDEKSSADKNLEIFSFYFCLISKLFKPKSCWVSPVFSVEKMFSSQCSVHIWIYVSMARGIPRLQP